jgi:serine protease AprX
MMPSGLSIECPLCHDKVDKLLYRYHIDGEKKVIEQIKKTYPEWAKNDGVCSRCVDYYHTEVVMQQRILPEIGPYFPVKSADDFIILPTGLRLDADPRYTGKGITICFIDSGFYPHPDVTAYKNRIKTITDITNPKVLASSASDGKSEVDTSMWHGTMTSVVCAGDGYLSNGLYKSIASDAELVLLKVMNAEGKITNENIVKALRWVLKNYRKYNIRIVNMSLGADEVDSYKHSEMDNLSEQLIEKGIVVVAAAGNDENGMIKPPANSPGVITVGGADDANSLQEGLKLYHSTYGTTVDGFMKPELIAHAIWLAAPVLPFTSEQREAEALYRLINTSDDHLISELARVFANTNLGAVHAQSKDVTSIREAILQRIQTCKYISPHYMHVDGTSFAAPIVCAVIAQLLEADPALTPSAIRELLFSTAKRMDSLPAERQGFGILQPRKALLKVLKKETIPDSYSSPFVNRDKKTIAFYINNGCASQISLAGSFNQWENNALLMEPEKNGFWKIEIPLLPAGKYQYKFLIDDKTWMEDVNNPYREPDGFCGFNSILTIEI